MTEKKEGRMGRAVKRHGRRIACEFPLFGRGLDRGKKKRSRRASLKLIKDKRGFTWSIKERSQAL